MAVHEQEVAGVGVGVEKAVVQDLFEIGVDEEPGGVVGHVGIGVAQGAGQVLALQPVEDEHAPGGEVAVHGGDDDGVVAHEVPGEALDVVGLAAVVELLQHRGLQRVGDGGQAGHLSAQQPVDQEKDAAGVPQLRGHDLRHPRVLDLHGHGAAVVAHGAMHLGQRGGRGRGGVEGGERLLRTADVLFHDAAHGGGGRGRDPVLQPRQLLHVDGRQQVGASGRELTELEEPAP